MSRGHVELVNASHISSRDLSPAGWPAGVRMRELSSDADTGAFTAVLEVPPGWRRPAGHAKAEVEWMLLDGFLRVQQQTRTFGYYEFAPAGSAQPAWSTESGCTMLMFARDGRPDFVAGPGASEAAGRITLDTEAMPWVVSPVPGPPEGMLLKLLRHVEATGEMTFLCTTVPRYDYPMLEFHDCVEEIYMIEGDMWLGNSGLMTAGSYFWRPPFITHGPFNSRTGSLMIAWVPSTLVNHVPLNANSSDEENLARFVAAGGARVLGDEGAVALGAPVARADEAEQAAPIAAPTGSA